MKQMMMTFKALILCLAIVITPGCGQQSELPQINGVQGPFLNVVDGQVLLTFKFLNMQVDAGLKAPIPKTKNSYIEFSPNMIDGGMILQAYMDVEDLKQIDLGIGDNNTLPDGRPIPGVAGGKLENSLRIDTQLYDMSFYYHKKIFGLWIPVGFETAGISGSFNIKVGKKAVGTIGLVGNDPERDLKAGAILFLRLDNLNDKDFQKLIKMSKRNPHRIY